MAAIGSDPFFQQTITYAIQPMANATDQAMVAIAEAYVSAPDNFIASQSLEIEAESAAYKSLFQTGITGAASPPFSCTSGNCTWDPFKTLAIRSQCQDVRNRLHVVCDDGGLNCNMTTNDYILNYAAPNVTDTGLQSQIMSISGLDGSALGMRGQAIDLDLVRRWGNIPGIISIVPWIRVNGSEIYSLQDATRNTTVEAQICIFYIAVVVVKAQVMNGLYHETVTHEFSDLSAVVNNKSDIGSSNSAIVKETTDDGTPWYHMGDAGTVSHQAKNRANSNAADPKKFEVDTSLVSGMSTQFEYYENGVAVGIFTKPVVTDTVTTRMLGLEPSVPQAFERMAQYMSFALRMNSSFTMPPNQAVANKGNPSYAPVAIGTSYSQVQLVNIRWGWLALPAVLLTLTVVFFFMTVVQSERAVCIGLWKNSPLALLFHADFDDDTIEGVHAKEDAGLLSSANGLKDIGTRMKAQLLRNKTGIKQMISIQQQIPENQIRWWKSGKVTKKRQRRT